jgi:hypothetical protein
VWGTAGGASGQFSEPGGIAVDDHGDVFVADRDNNRIEKFTADGRFLLSWGSAGTAPSDFSLPVDVASDHAGNVYVADLQNARVEKYSGSGAFEWATPSLGGQPWFLVAAPTGIYVQLTNNSMIVKLDPVTGTVAATIPRPPSLNGGLVVRPDGSLLLLDWQASIVDIMQPDGMVSGSFAQLGTRSGNGHLALDARGRLYTEEACNTAGAQVVQFSILGTAAGSWSEPLAAPSGCVSGIATSPDGRYVYIAHNVADQIERVDTESVTARITAAPTAVLTGQPFTVSAAATVPFSTITSFAWGVDTPDAFAAGSDAAGTFAYTETVPGAHTIAVNALSPDGYSGVASTSIVAYPAPPDGETGISLNDGAQFTNTPNVAVRVVWPPFATDVRLSNDGGFASLVSSHVIPTLPWTLDSSGPERLPKTIYVRFSGLGIDTTKTFTDDIILDETPPSVSASASVSVVAASSRKTQSISKLPLVAMRIRATDELSGVARMEITPKKDRPGPARPYRMRVTLRTTAHRIYVRAQDRAGNWSSWRRIAVKTVRGAKSGRK